MYSATFGESRACDLAYRGDRRGLLPQAATHARLCLGCVGWIMQNTRTVTLTQQPTDAPIPFCRPFALGTEFSQIQRAIETCELSGDGSITKRCHAFLEQTLGVHKALLTTSCTHALEISALLLRLRPGDEVIVPSFTFVSTANAFALHGAKPVFVDIRPDTLNMDEALVESLITE